jgi:hypothetical protein
MRIVRIRHLFYPDMPRNYFYELSSRQANEGPEVDLITWRQDTNSFEEKVVGGFAVHNLVDPNLSQKKSPSVSFSDWTSSKTRETWARASSQGMSPLFAGTSGAKTRATRVFRVPETQN